MENPTGQSGNKLPMEMKLPNLAVLLLLTYFGGRNDIFSFAEQ
jgi:hypothetical protein